MFPTASKDYIELSRQEKHSSVVSEGGKDWGGFLAGQRLQGSCLSCILPISSTARQQQQNKSLSPPIWFHSFS